MRTELRPLPALVALCSLALVATIGLVALLPMPAGALSQQQAVAQAWEQARSSGTYRFRSDLTQVTSAAPSLRTAGAAPHEDRLALEGRVDQAAEELELTLWRGAAGDPNTGISIKVANGQATARRGQGEWQPLDTPADLFAPGGDPLGFLAAARDFSGGESDTRTVGSATFRYTRYNFRIDGPAFAEHMRVRLEKQLHARGELPPGVSLQSADAYRRMAGQGTLWVDADGLPRRMELSISTPGQPGETIAATIASDFLDFDRSRLALATTSFFASPNAWLSYRLDRYGPQLRELALGLAACLAVAGLLLLSVSLWRSRRFQTVFAAVMIAAILGSPLIQAQRVAAAAERLDARQAAQAAAREQAAAQEQALGAVGVPDSDPHQMPRADALATAAAASAAVDSTDSDGDGLTNSEETTYGTCATLGSTTGNCAGVASALDSDGDGIGDGIEVKQVGTNPDTADSDGDTISDYLEVNGFVSGGKTWYLNPNASDTNKDGQLDSAECLVWSKAAASYSASGACPDSDGDKTPDVWDDDNDDDGVLDGADLSPATKGGAYTDSNPFTLSVGNLQMNQPVFVDVQIRPSASQQLSYIGSVLDWPAGDDEGQITRHNSTTFATSDNPSLVSSDASAANGDLKIVPLLEITMPGTSGHYANLPVKSAYTNQARPAGAAADTWLDSDALDAYGITVRDVDTASGKLTTYVPLSVVYGSDGSGLQAYTARMLYQPSRGANGVADWGAAQEFRVIWLVELLSDECVSTNALTGACTDYQDKLEVIQIYRDESWTLSGLEVREDHGLDVKILYEDPARDADRSSDDALWAASWALSNSFLRGRDCGASAASCIADGTRDVTLANMETLIHSWSGNTDPIAAYSVPHYAHQGYLAKLAMTETPALLSRVFTSYAASVDPTLLFAREESHRTLNLDGAGSPAGALSLDMSSTNAPLLLQANLSWASYDFQNGVWANYDSGQNLSRIATVLGKQSFFQAADSSVDSVAAASGKLLWAQFYYATLANGLTSVIGANSTLLFTPSTGEVPEISYAASWPSGLGTGAGFVAFEYLNVLTKIMDPVASSGNFWKDLSNAFTSQQSTVYLRENLKYGAVTGNLLMAANHAATLAGTGLFLAGYLTGDSDVLLAGEIVLGAVTIVTSLAWGANLVTGLVAAGGALKGLGTTAVLSGLSSVSKSTRAIGPSGMLIGAVVTWGLFGVQMLIGWASGGLNDLYVNSAAAYALAGTIVLFIMFVIDLVPIVGTLIVLAVYIVDVFLSWFCKTTCHGGAQAALTEVIAASLYSVDNVLDNLASPDRLDFAITHTALSSPSAGFTTANSATYTIAVTNTIHYSKDYDDSEGNNATFRYYLDQRPNDRHASLALRQMEDAWTPLSGRYLRTTTSVTSAPISFATVGAGINRDLGGNLYLNEAFATPYAGCWLFFGVDTNNCSYYAISDTNHIELGSYIVYDLLPGSLNALLATSWNKGDAMPTPRDPDGDGLIARAYGGADPNDKNWDGDGDGLSDEYELDSLLNPADTDSDDDGLTDRQELQLGLPPTDSDADNDGLSDAQEQAGWRFGYLDQSSVQRIAWVWPDPYSADADADGLNDLQEFYYGLNPGVATDSDAVLKTVTFGDSSLSETTAPLLLARFEESASATSFADDSGDDRPLTCDSASAACPTAGTDGRYGYALSLDGANDYLSGASVTELGKGSFTIAAWVKATRNNQGIVTKSDGDNSWESGEKSFYLDASGYPTFAGNGNNYIRSATSVIDGSWHHVAVTWAYTSGTSGTGKIYVDGANVTTTVTYAANNADNAADTMRVGRANHNPGQGSSNFLGAIDELAVYGRALAASDIATLMSARYNVDDGSVAPGDSLTYSLTINDNSATYPARATYYGELADTAYSYEPRAPYGEWQFEELLGSSFADSSGRGYTATCTNCPALGTSGRSGSGLRFDGVNDEIVLDTASRAAGKGSGFSFGAWVYPTGGANGYHTIYASLNAGTGTGFGDTRDGLYYDTANQMFFGETVGNTGSGSAPLNQWHHLMVTIEPESQVQRLYLNGSLKSSNFYGLMPSDNGRFRVGGASRFIPFAGRMDSITLYDRRLTTSEVQQVMAGSTTIKVPLSQALGVYTVPSLGSVQVAETTTVPLAQPGGAYRSRHVVEAALDIPDETNSGSATPDPDTTLEAHYDFDDPPGDTTFSDSARRTGDATCASSSACPVMGIRGAVNRAARFDGNDQVQTFFNDGYNAYPHYSVAAWVKARDGIVAQLPDGGIPFRLWLDRYDYNRSWRGGYDATASIDATSPQRWRHVVITYNGTEQVYQHTIYIDGELVNNPYPYAPGYGAGGKQPFYIGSLLDGYIDDLRIYSRTLGASDVQTLYQTSRPQLQLEFEEASGATGFEDTSANGYTAAIVDAAGVPGRIGSGASFNGTSAYAKIASAPALASVTKDVTLIAWVNPDSVSGTQRFISSGLTNSNNGFSLGMVNGKLWFTAHGVREYLSTATLKANSWQQVAVVFDSTYKAKFYLNGVYIDSVAGSAPLLANTDDPLYIGGRTATGSTSVIERYSGKLDELFVYTRGLSDAEIERNYYNQFRWFRKQRDLYVTVDTDKPTIALVNGENNAQYAGYWPNQPVQLVVKASDATSKVWSFEYGIAAPGKFNLTWQGATRCAGSDSDLWCPTFDPRTMGGQGSYLVKFRAVDAVGNETTSGLYTVMIDGKAPTFSASYSNTLLDLTADAEDELSWTVALSGTVTDPKIVWRDETISMDLFGPLKEGDVTVSLVDSTGAVAGMGAQPANLASGPGYYTWSLDYALVGQRPGGVYTVRLAATDQVGNSATADVGTVVLDARPPSPQIDTDALGRIIAGGATLSGVLSEQPAPAGAVASYHFEESDGSSFADYSGAGNIAGCTACPNRASGPFGQALEFNRDANTALTVPATTTLDLSVGTLSAWVKPTWAAGSNGYSPGILGIRNGDTARFSWHISDDYSAIELYNNAQIFSAPISMAANQWHHVALVQSGTTWTAYLDGAVVGSAHQSFGDALGVPLTIGSSGANGEFFSGLIDEVALFSRALSADEIYALAQSQVSGGSSAEIGLARYSPDSGLGATEWQPLSLGLSAADVAGDAQAASATGGLVTWSYPVPDGLEGFYKILLRGLDAQGNGADASTVWAGAIDTRQPRMTVSARQRFGGTLAVTEYSLSVDDDFLDPASLALPCAFTRTTSTDPETGQINHATATCSLPGLVSDQASFTACDYAGNCAARLVLPEPTTGEPDIIISSPASDLSTGMTAIAVGGSAYAGAGVSSVSLSVDGVPVTSFSYPEQPTQVAWSLSWTPPGPGQHTLTAQVNSSAGSATATRAFTVSRSDAPGGVSGGLGIWLRADSGQYTSSAGAPVGALFDRAQGWTAQNSADQAPTLKQDAFNFHPALSFGASGPSELSFGARTLSAPSSGDGMTVFALGSPGADTGAENLLLDAGAYPGGGYGLALSASGSAAHAPAADSPGAAQTVQAPAAAGPTLLTYALRFGVGSSLAVNGASQASTPNTALSAVGPANVAYSPTHDSAAGPITIGRQAQGGSGVSRYFRGDLSELIVFNTALSDAERRRVESYLALRYSASLAAGQDYTASNSAVIWNATANAAHQHNIAGIGRDDSSGLNQTRARSGDGRLIIAANSAIASDRSFLIWGDDGGALSDIAERSSTNALRDRLSRIWKFSETGDLGALKISFDLSGLGLTIDPSRVSLLVDDDGNFANASAYTAGRSVSGSVVSFSGLNLKSGQYISLLLRYRPEVVLSNATTLSSVKSGDIVTFTLQLRNGGSTTASGVSLVMPLPAELSETSYQAALDTGLSITQLPGPGYIWSISDMVAGKGGTIRVSGRLNAASGQTVSTTATLSATDDFDSSNNSVTLSLTVGNTSPTLDPLGDRETLEGSLVAFVASGADPDQPTQTLSYSLVDAPAGASIDQSSGAFSWTPSEEQGGNSYSFAVRVSDGELSAERGLTVTVREVNSSPTLDPLAEQTVNEGSTLSFTAAGADSDLPVQALIYSLVDAPSGASIDPSSGAFSWTPSEDQGPGSYSFAVKVEDVTGQGDDSVGLSASVPLTVVVGELNQAPSIDPIADLVVEQGAPVSLQVAGSDGDLPAQALTYSLVQGPEGASIDPSSGIVSWTPASTGAFTVRVAVSDGALNAEASFTINVRGEGVSYGAQAPASVVEGGTLTFTIRRSGLIGQAGQVAYSLGGTASAGADYASGQSGLVSFAAGQEQATVSLAISDDAIAEGAESLSLTLSAGSGPQGEVSYDPATVSAAIVDNDSARAVFSATSLSLNQGGSQALKLRLSSQPTAPVQVHVSSSSPAVCTVSPADLELNATNWQAGVEVTVTAVGAGVCMINGETTSADPRYAGLELEPVAVTSTSGWRLYLPLLQR